MGQTHSFHVDLAVKYGIAKAILLEYLCFWQQKNEANGKHLHDGRYWVYNSIAAFHRLFPYLSERQIRYALNSLKEEGAIHVGNYNKHKYDRTIWYSVDDAIYQKVTYHLTKGQKDLTEGVNEDVQKGEPIPASYTASNTASYTEEEHIQSGLENPTAFTEGLEEKHAFREANNSPEGEGIGDIDSPVSTGGSTHSKRKVDRIPYKEIIDYLNEKADTEFKATVGVTRRYIKARWNEGFRLEDFKKVIDKKVRQWKHKPDMVEFLRPTTLFGTKFEAYLMAAQHKTGWEIE